MPSLEMWALSALGQPPEARAPIHLPAQHGVFTRMQLCTGRGTGVQGTALDPGRPCKLAKGSFYRKAGVHSWEERLCDVL